MWGSVGFATVILSAALKSIPSEILEAARVDGATERQVFFGIIIPMVSLPISVLAVTLLVNVVKLFDLIYVLTNGGPGVKSRVIAFTMYTSRSGRPVRPRRRGRRDHAHPVAPDHGLQHQALPSSRVT